MKDEQLVKRVGEYLAAMADGKIEVESQAHVMRAVLDQADAGTLALFFAMAVSIGRATVLGSLGLAISTYQQVEGERAAAIGQRLTNDLRGA